MRIIAPRTSLPRGLDKNERLVVYTDADGDYVVDSGMNRIEFHDIERSSRKIRPRRLEVMKYGYDVYLAYLISVINEESLPDPEADKFWKDLAFSIEQELQRFGSEFQK